MDMETDITAKTIYGEARGEGLFGMEAVANVIRNRVAIAKQYVLEHDKPHPLFGNGTFADCCMRPEQFSCWNQNDPNRAIIEDLMVDSGIIAQTAYTIASEAVDGTLSDNTDGATYYYAKSISAPFWAKGQVPCADIGNQFFFKL